MVLVDPPGVPLMCVNNTVATMELVVHPQTPKNRSNNISYISTLGPIIICRSQKYIYHPLLRLWNCKTLRRSLFFISFFYVFFLIGYNQRQHPQLQHRRLRWRLLGLVELGPTLWGDGRWHPDGGGRGRRGRGDHLLLKKWEERKNNYRPSTATPTSKGKRNKLL